MLSELFDGLTSKSRPFEFFKKLDAPESEYLERAANSEGYRAWRIAHKMDAIGKDGQPKKSYRDASEISNVDMRLLDAAIILNGLDPAVSRHHQFSKERLAIVGHRVAHLFTEGRYKMVRKFNHPSDVSKMKPKGTPGRDNLGQVGNMLKSMGKSFRRMLASKGSAVSGDEETLGFQGAADGLKQNCDRFKAAGDGLQSEAFCVRLGILTAFAFRGHTLLPNVSVKNKPSVKLSPLHQRVIWVAYLADMQAGQTLAMDNLYNSVDFAHMLELGETFTIDIPAGWIADIYDDDDESAKVIEWTSPPGIHMIGTLRGNRGSERAYQGKEKMTKAQEEALKAKSLMPERVKARVTNDRAQVITVAIFDKKWFQMIDTVHTEIKVETKPRRIFDRATNRPGTKMIDIMNTPNLYNQIMGFVDLDDLMAWYYRCARLTL